MGSPHSGGSVRSGEHVDSSSDGRGSGSKGLGTLNAGEVDCLWGGHRCGEWCPWWLIGVGLVGGSLASFDGTPGGVGSSSTSTSVHPDSSSTAAESLTAGLSTSGWSPGTVGEGLLTSGALCAWCGHGLLGKEIFDGFEIGVTLVVGSLEGGSVCIVSL